MPVAPGYKVDVVPSLKGKWRDVYLVSEPPSGNGHVVVVRFVDFREHRPRIGSRLVRFNRKKDAPEVTDDILLRTPSYYRKQEGGDTLDGAVKVDYSPVISNQLRKAGMPIPDGNLSATATFVSTHEPWVYCTSIAPANRASAKALEGRFSSGKGSDASVTVIEDRERFARQFGVDLALAVDTGRDISMDALHLIRHYRWEAALGVRPVAALVEVFHGPVTYRDEKLALGKHTDLPDPVKTCFTKRARFSEENEYRFVVAAAHPKVDTLRLSMSTALANLMTCVPIGDRGGWFPR